MTEEKCSPLGQVEPGPAKRATAYKPQLDITIKKYKISTYYAPDDERYFKFVRKAEDGETKEGKHTCLWTEKVKLVLRTDQMKTKRRVVTKNWKSLTTHKGHCAQCLLHEDLSDGRQVVMSVVRHRNSSKQDRHNSC